MKENRETTIVNVKHPHAHTPGSPFFFTRYIGRGTKFGNNYRIGFDGSREEVIAKHKKDFYDDPELQERVWNELRGETIACNCKPKACHGDTYVEYIRNRMRKIQSSV